MDREFYKKPGLSENHSYRKGMKLGSQVLDPLSLLQLTDDPSFGGRKEFLAGYAVELENYLARKRIILPIGTHYPKDEIDFPSYLFGIATGLKRALPNTPMVHEFHGSGPEDPQTWADTLSFIHNIAKKDGYMIGFLVSLARDYNIITHGHAVPRDIAEYQVYLDGLSAKPSKYFLRKGDKSLGGYAPEEYDKRIYLTGLKVWLHEQGLGTIMCPVLLTHPQTLAAFKEFVTTRNISESSGQLSEAQFGYELAQIALSARSQK